MDHVCVEIAWRQTPGGGAEATCERLLEEKDDDVRAHLLNVSAGGARGGSRLCGEGEGGLGVCKSRKRKSKSKSKRKAKGSEL